MNKDYYYFDVPIHEMYDIEFLRNGHTHPYLRPEFISDMECLNIWKICLGPSRRFCCSSIGPAIGNLGELQFKYWGDTGKFEIKFYDYNKELAKMIQGLGRIHRKRKPAGFRAVGWHDCCRQCINCDIFDDGSGECGVNNGFEIDNVDEAICDDFIRRD